MKEYHVKNQTKASVMDLPKQVEQNVNLEQPIGNQAMLATVYKGNIIKFNNGLPILRRDTAQTRLRAVFL